MYFPFSRIIRKQGANLCGKHRVNLNGTGLYEGRCKSYGRASLFTTASVINLSNALRRAEKYAECISFLREEIPFVEGELGPDSDDVLRLRFNYANCLLEKGSSRHGVNEAVTILEDIVPRVRRVLGANHPFYSSVLDRQKSATQRLQKRGRATESSSAPASSS